MRCNKCAYSICFTHQFSKCTQEHISVDIYLQLIHSNIFIAEPLVKAPTDFNVIPHFLAQCGSEPWTTTITAGAICCTPPVSPTEGRQDTTGNAPMVQCSQTRRSSLLRQLKVKHGQDKVKNRGRLHDGYRF